MPINSALFAHIENDAFLTGIYKLQGIAFIQTIEYLRNYLEQLKRKGEIVNPKYFKLLKDMSYLAKTEHDLKAAPLQVNAIAKTIADNIALLPIGGKILIPGGWSSTAGGHSMIYEFTRDATGYHFIVVNSGGGLEYHARESAQDKELYNPIKIWSVPIPTTAKGQTEIQHFISRLLKAQIPNQLSAQQKPYDAEVLYKEVIPSISHIGGVEEDAHAKLPAHAYTGGQLSGTCSERVLHQMLKINSDSADEYQHFIFQFKQHALFDYADGCLRGDQPFNTAVANQILLAIENNLKILNASRVFSEVEIEAICKKLTDLKEVILKHPFLKAAEVAFDQDMDPFFINDNVLATPIGDRDTSYNYSVSAAIQIDLNDKTNILTHLEQYLRKVEALESPAARYSYLEKLLIDLPFTLDRHTYPALVTTAHYEVLATHINKIQDLLHTLKKDWIKDAQIAKLQVITLVATKLQSELHTIITTQKNLPSFEPFTAVMMQSMISNHNRDPFWATNDPVLDEKIKLLQEHYVDKLRQDYSDYNRYLIRILDTEPLLKADLLAKYQSTYGTNVEPLHKEIRANGLQALYLISRHMKSIDRLDAKYNPIITKIQAHIDFESEMRRHINPFWKEQFSEQKFMDFIKSGDDAFWVSTPLFPALVTYQTLSKEITKHKYAQEPSAASAALEADISEKTRYSQAIESRTGNDIQLNPILKGDEKPSIRSVTQADIEARDYFHLRSVPSLQIALTLDYFTRNIDKLSHQDNQRYVEANLFQPGLLAEALKTESFMPQFDAFLKKGLRYFTETGQHTPQSLVFLRLDFLTSSYQSRTGSEAGILRLQALQKELTKQLQLVNTPEVTYVLQQYLFLTTQELIRAGRDISASIPVAMNAYFYLQGHTNPQILEDSTHHVDMEIATTKFQELISGQPRYRIVEAIEKILNQSPELAAKKLAITGNFPVYNLTNKEGLIVYQFNAVLGKLFEKGLARSGIPLAVQNHPLMKQLGLENVRECLMTANGTRMILLGTDPEVRLYYKNKALTVEMDWVVDGKKESYELQALTQHHQAQRANPAITSIRTDLPKMLTDGSMNYWKHTTKPGKGLLVQNNVPVYSTDVGVITTIDDTGATTPYKLTALDATWTHLLTVFEDASFMLPEVAADHTLIKLPRFGLNFEVQMKGARSVFVYPHTGEEVVDSPSPIHPNVAGIVLTQDDHSRYLVPVARFYVTEDNALPSEFYPVVHDIDGTIAQECLEESWNAKKLVERPLWNYQNSEHYVSFLMKDGAPIADTVADALYLVYIYLATNQTEKAWKTLDDCTTRLGGLTGHPDELKYLSWICKEMPHILPSEKANKDIGEAVRETPPYVACQLKALSLACDYLSQDLTFNLVEPDLSKNTANAHYEHIQFKQSQDFLNALPTTIYNSFSRLQSMRRHLESTYTLSSSERKHLLNYYHQNNVPRGALGHEWMLLTIETIQKEHDALSARSKVHALSEPEKLRLKHIEEHLKKLKPIMAKSSALKLVAIDLNVPTTLKIKRGALNPAAVVALDAWHDKIPVPGQNLSDDDVTRALEKLSSSNTDSEFIINFPAYVQVALSSNPVNTKILQDFCTRTLIAQRHIKLDAQLSNIPLLCNILYHMLNNKGYFSHTQKITDIIANNANYPVPALQVYEAEDVYQAVLSTPAEILAQQRLKMQAPLNTTKVPNLPLIEPITKEIQLAPFIAQYQKLQQEHEEAQEALAKTLTDDLEQSLAVELNAGKELRTLEQHKTDLAEKLIKTPGLAQKIITNIGSMEAAILGARDKIWNEALALANQGPEDAKLARIWRIERASKARATLSKADLCSLYAGANLTKNIEQTGLSRDNAQKLHTLIHQALTQSIQCQMIEKIKEGLTKAIAGNKPYEAVPALDLLSQLEIPATDEPTIVLIQHEEQTVLRPRQISALKTLLEQPEDGSRFRETVEKIIPGGGKSKYILPIVAEKKAQGDNLVIIEVPQALLATNHVDLNRVSQRLFGKKAYRFEFNRDSNSSSARLEQLYLHFVEIMTSRGYLVTTGESIQSLELKYLELLLIEGEKTPEWKQQVYWCDKIVNLVRHQADCMMDEAHQGLWIKKKLNYTLGNPTPIGTSLIKNAIALYSFIDPEFIKTAPSLSQDYDWTEFKTNLVAQLINDATSPIKAFVDKAILIYGPDIKTQLIAYLTNTAKTTCEAITRADPETKAALAFFKQEINVLLPQTLVRRFEEKYGASKRKHLGPIERTLAIPYAANNIPNERSRFGNTLEGVNNTIQMMLIKGISKELLIEKIAQWQSAARKELFQNVALAHLDETPTAQGFTLLLSDLGLTLSQINLKDDKQITTLHARLQYNRALIFDLLQAQSLKQIQESSAIIHSDSFNHVDLYRSVQAVSGTPSNHTTFHQRLHYDKTSSLGTDGYIIQALNDKKTPITSLDYTNVSQFVTNILSNSKQRSECRAIIDIRATFQGVCNIEVAQAIAIYLRANPKHFSTPLKHVLYFNEDQVLCAIHIDKPKEPILLKTSDEKEINRLLGSTPSQRFTFYDQVRTLGTDITQEEHAHALVLVDEKTSLQAFLQGSMRMRGLNHNQTIELVVPENLEGTTLPELVKRFSKAEQRTLLMDNLFAAKAQMKNLVRRRFLTLIQDLPAEKAQEKWELTRQLKEFFVDNPSTNLFELYGAISTKQPTVDILGNYKKQIITQWEKCIKSATAAQPSAQDSRDIDVALQKIIKQAIPHCLAEYEGVDDGLAVEVEVQKEVQAEVQAEVLTINDVYNPALKEDAAISWPYFLSDIYASKWALDSVAMPLNEICFAPEGDAPLFSPELRISHNQAKSYIGQSKYIDAFLKPVFLVWYHYYQGVLKAMIITPQDADKLKNKLAHTPDSWISTTQDTVLYGARPAKTLEDVTYQSLREQVRFFNGELAALANDETPLNWMIDNPAKKLAFYERQLLRYRPGSKPGLDGLSAALNKPSSEGFDYIAENPFKDFTDFDWVATFPETLPSQVTEYQRVAQAFQYVNQNWTKQHLKLIELQQKFRLPINTLAHLEKHLNHLKNLNAILDAAGGVISDRSFLACSLKEQEQDLLYDILGSSLENICELYGIPSASPDATFLGIKPTAAQIKERWQRANIHALILLRAYPATPKDSVVDRALEHLAANALSKDALLGLLKMEQPSSKIIDTILDHKLCDDSFAQPLLDLSHKYSEIQLYSLATICRTVPEIEKFFKIPHLTNHILGKILRHKVIKILDENSADSRRIISIIAAHPKVEIETLIYITTLPSFSPESAQEIIKRQGVTISPALLTIIATRIFSDKLSTTSPVWEDTVLLILQQGLKTLDHVQLVTLSSKIQIDSKFGLRILKTLGKDALLLRQIPIITIINEADKETLKTLADPKMSPFSQEERNALRQKCDSEELISLFLARTDITDEDILFIVNNHSAQLTEEQLILILNKTLISDELFNEVCSHPKVAQQARQAILRHNLLTTEILAALIKNKPINEEEILSLLKSNNKEIIDFVLPLITKEFLENPNICAALVESQQDNTDINDQYSSPEIFQKIVENTGDAINPNLLTTMARKSFDQYINNPSTDRIAWENCLIKIFNQAVKINTSEIMISFISEHDNLNPKFALRIFGIFRAPVMHMLPLRSMISIAAKEDIDLLIQTSPLKPVAEDILISLSQKCKTNEQISQLLQHPNLTDKVLTHIVKRNLTEEHLLLILKQNLSEGTLRAVYNHSSTTRTVREAIYQHDVFSSAVLASLIRNSSLSEVEMLKLFNRAHPAINLDVLSMAAQIFINSLPVLTAVISHPQIDKRALTLPLLTKLIEEGDLTPKMIQTMLQKKPESIDKVLLNKIVIDIFRQYEIARYPEEKTAWENCLLLAIKHAISINASTEIKEHIQRNKSALDAHMGFKLFNLFGKSILQDLPLEQMMDSADSGQLDLLIQIEELTQFELTQLTNKDLDTRQINTLLSRKDMTSTIADNLFKKPTYDNKINNWTWLTEQQLKATLTNTRDFASFKQALTHHNLSANARKEWFEKMKQEQDNLEKQAQNSPDPQLKLSAALGNLKIKAWHHAIASLDDKKYSTVAETAFVLHQKIELEKNKYFSPYPPTKNQFLSVCSTLITDAKPILEVHRGYKQALLNILNAILYVLTGTLSTLRNGSWRFFQANTDTLNVANKIIGSLDDSAPKIKP